MSGKSDVVSALCKQCGGSFVPRNKANLFCSRECQADSRSGRPASESLSRAETGFAWQPVVPARPVKVVVPKRKVNFVKGWRTAVIIPDQQFGYRRFLDSLVLDPFHDPRAVSIVEQIVEVERPDVSVMLGDLNDLPTYGKYVQEPEFVGGVQPGIDRASVHVATVSELSGRTVILKGNHDARIENFVMQNSASSVGLRRARRLPGEFPVLTMEFMLGISEMRNVEMIGGYPSGAFYLNDDVACIHGRITGENLAKKVINSERVSVIFGHVHTLVDGIQTFNRRGFPQFVRAHSPGCVCRVDGAVPSAKSGRDAFGHPMKSWENWSQGLSVVRYREDDGRFSIEHIPIQEGWAMYRGQEFVSDLAVNDPELHIVGR